MTLGQLEPEDEPPAEDLLLMGSLAALPAREAAAAAAATAAAVAAFLAAALPLLFPLLLLALLWSCAGGVPSSSLSEMVMTSGTGLGADEADVMVAEGWPCMAA